MFAKDSRGLRRVAVALAGACAGLAAPPALAQPGPPGYAEPDVGGLTVYAPYRYARQPTTGARVRMDSVSMVVPLDDLDLSSRRGARLAKARIEAAARAVCQDAEDIYPQDVPPPGGCYSRALRQGLAEAQNVAGYPILAWGYR